MTYIAARPPMSFANNEENSHDFRSVKETLENLQNNCSHNNTNHDLLADALINTIPISEENPLEKCNHVGNNIPTDRISVKDMVKRLQDNSNEINTYLNDTTTEGVRFVTESRSNSYQSETDIIPGRDHTAHLPNNVGGSKDISVTTGNKVGVQPEGDKESVVNRFPVVKTSEAHLGYTSDKHAHDVTDTRSLVLSQDGVGSKGVSDKNMSRDILSSDKEAQVRVSGPRVFNNTSEGFQKHVCVVAPGDSEHSQSKRIEQDWSFSSLSTVDTSNEIADERRTSFASTSDENSEESLDESRDLFDGTSAAGAARKVGRVLVLDSRVRDSPLRQESDINQRVGAQAAAERPSELKTVSAPLEKSQNCNERDSLTLQCFPATGSSGNGYENVNNGGIVELEDVKLAEDTGGSPTKPAAAAATSVAVGPATGSLGISVMKPSVNGGPATKPGGAYSTQICESGLTDVLGQALGPSPPEPSAGGRLSVNPPAEFEGCGIAIASSGSEADDIKESSSAHDIPDHDSSYSSFTSFDSSNTSDGKADVSIDSIYRSNLDDGININTNESPEMKESDFRLSSRDIFEPESIHSELLKIIRQDEEDTLRELMGSAGGKVKEGRSAGKTQAFYAADDRALSPNENIYTISSATTDGDRRSDNPARAPTTAGLNPLYAELTDENEHRQLETCAGNQLADSVNRTGEQTKTCSSSQPSAACEGTSKPLPPPSPNPIPNQVPASSATATPLNRHLPLLPGSSGIDLTSSEEDHPRESLVDLMVSRLKELYQENLRLVHPIYGSMDEVPLDEAFIDLELKVIEKNGEEVSISLEDLYQKIRERKREGKLINRIFIEGVAGCGKSTLARKMAHDWSQPDRHPALNEFEALWLVEARKIQSDVQEAIINIVHNDHMDISAREIWRTLLHLGEKNMVILDGYDELNKKYDRDVLSLMDGNIVDQACVVVTSCPGALCKFDCDMQIRIDGFSHANSLKIVENYLNHGRAGPDGKHRDIVERLLEDLDYNGLSDFAKYPLPLALLCITCLGEDIDDFDIPKDRLQLYQSFERCLIQDYCLESGIDLEYCKRIVLQIYHIAAIGLQSGQYLFEESSLINAYPDEEIYESGFLHRVRPVGGKSAHSYLAFTHKTMQEYLAAKDILKIHGNAFVVHFKYFLQNHIGVCEFIVLGLPLEDPRMSELITVFQSMCEQVPTDAGYLEDEYLDMDAYTNLYVLLQRIQFPKEAMNKVAMKLHPHVTVTDLCIQNGSVKLLHPGVPLKGLVIGDSDSLHSAENPYDDRHSAEKFFDVVSKMSTLEEIFFRNISYLRFALMTKPTLLRSSGILERLHIYSNKDSDIFGSNPEGTPSFTVITPDIADAFQTLTETGKFRPTLDSLCFSNNWLPGRSAIPFAKAFSILSNIQQLQICLLSESEGEVSEFLPLFDAIAAKDTLIELDLSHSVNLNGADASCLAKFLSESTVSKLTIDGFAKIDGSVGDFLTPFLVLLGYHDNKTIQTISLSDIMDRISAQAYSTEFDLHIGTLLKQKMCIETLFIDNNNLSKLAEIGNALAHNSKLNGLYLMDNQIDFEGCIDLAEGLKKNTTLQELSLSRNPIGDFGAIAIGDALKHNKSLRKLYMNNCHIMDEGVDGFAINLAHNRSLELLSLAENDFGGQGVWSLAKALPSTEIGEFSLKNKDMKLSNESVKALAQCLSKSKSLQRLYLMKVCFLRDEGHVLQELANAANWPWEGVERSDFLPVEPADLDLGPLTDVNDWGYELVYESGCDMSEASTEEGELIEEEDFSDIDLDEPEPEESFC